VPKTPGKPPLSIVSGETAAVSPPRPLGSHGRALWDRVQREYQIADTGGVEILAQICAAQDRVEALCAQINEDGAIIRTRNGLKANPLLRDETALRAFIVRTIERLGLNIEAVKSSGRPPGGGLGWTPEGVT
jgi:P27 family predicted phage terminase small subunit